MGHPAIAEGEVAVVTGAALGIGRALARRFVALGLKTALLDVDASHLETARSGIGGETLALEVDVADPVALEGARARIEEHWGRVPAVLVNNAATRIGRGIDAPLDAWHRLMEVNLFGVVNGVRAFMPGMQAAGRPGLIVNVGSKQGITSPPGHPVYNMSKSAVKTYTECLEHALRQEPERRVTARLLVPGWTTTGLNEHKPGAWLPDQVVDYMLAALAKDSFYIICPDDETSEEEDRARVLWAAGDIAEDRPALSRWHADWKDVYRQSRSG